MAACQVLNVFFFSSVLIEVLFVPNSALFLVHVQDGNDGLTYLIHLCTLNPLKIE